MCRDGPDPEAPIALETDTEIKRSPGAPADSGDSAGDRGPSTDSRELRWMLGAVVGAVLVVLAALVIVRGGSSEFQVDEVTKALEARVEPGGAMSTFTQPTDHPIRLPPTWPEQPGRNPPTGLTWEHIAGRWGTLGNRAYVYRPADPDGGPIAITPGEGKGTVGTIPAPPTDDNLLVIPMTEDATTEVMLDRVAPGAGLAFRLTDAENYLAVVVSPDGTGWELVRMLDGVVEVEPIATAAPRDGTVVAVNAARGEVEVFVNGQSVHTTNGEAWSGPNVGLIVRGAESTGPKGAMFDNFLANPAAGSVAGGAQVSD